MNQKTFQTHLLSFGMILFSLTVAACLFNVLFFHYARGLHSMTLLLTVIIFAVYTLLLFSLSRFLKHADTDKLEHCAAWLVPAFLLVSFVLMLLCGFWLAHKPFCDNAFVLHGADIISRHGYFPQGIDDFTYDYLLHFPNQWGFTMLLSLLPFEQLNVSIGSNGILYLLSGIESFLFMLSFSFLLHTVRKRFGVRAQLQLVFCLASFLPHYTASAVLYTDTFSMPFVLLALCCMLQIDDRTPPRTLLLLILGYSISLLIGCLIKTTCLILFIAAAIVWLLTLHPKRAAACILIPLFIVSVGMQAFNYTISHSIFDSDEAAQKKVPLLHWFMMSLPTDDNYYGSNREEDYAYTYSLMAQNASEEEILQSIYERIGERLSSFTSFKDVFSAVLRKNANYIGDGTFGMTEMLDDMPIRENILSQFVLYDRPYYSLYTSVCGGMWYAHLLLSAFVCLKDVEKRQFDLAIPIIAFLGLIIFEMLWEARSRYLFNLTPLIFLISACGMTRRVPPMFPHQRCHLPTDPVLFESS